MENGLIKFNCHWKQSGPVINDYEMEQINNWREILFNLGLVGAYENGIGFGNLSIRSGKGNQFFITGSSTGEIPVLEEYHYVKVNAFNLDENSLLCTGPLKASSESLSHAAIYRSDPGTQAVIHVHDAENWRKLKDQVPTTHEDAEYGSPELAREIMSLFKTTNVMEKRIIVMGGHPEGILSFGSDMDEAAQVLLKHLGKVK